MSLSANQLRSALLRRTLLGILMYSDIHSGSCAAGGFESPSLATVSEQAHQEVG